MAATAITVCNTCGKRLVTEGLLRGTVVICASCRARFPLQTGAIAIAPTEALDPDEDRTRIVHWMIPVERSGWAVAAGYLGLLALLPLTLSTLALVAVIAQQSEAQALVSPVAYDQLFSYLWYAGLAVLLTGFVARRDLKRHPNRRGTVRTGFALVVGGLVCATHFTFRAWLFSPVIRHVASLPWTVLLIATGGALTILYIRFRRRWILITGALLLTAGVVWLVLAAG